MFRAAFRNLIAHRLRLLLSGMSIVLGVGFVSGAMIYTDTLDKTFSSLLDKTSSDVRVEAKGAFKTGPTGSGGHGAQATVPETLVEDIAAVDGVAAASGHVQSEGVYVLDESGDVHQTGGAPGVGVSWTDDERVTPARLIDGRAPATRDEVALDSTTADALGYGVGDRITVLTPGPRLTLDLVGVFTYGEDGGGLAGASMVAFDLETAQELVVRPGEVTEVNVAASGRTSDAELQDRIEAAIGTGYAVETRSEQTDAAAAAIEEGLSFITTFLLVFAAVSLFVGSFIILNTFAMLVAQRTRELALLRALGSSRRQVTLAVLTEALVLGVLGATAGLAGGYGLAHGLRALMAQFGLSIDGELVFSASTVVWSYAVGIGVTLVAAYLPARRAARVAPVTAMREDLAPRTTPLTRRAAGGTLVGLTGAGTLALALSGGSTALVGVGAAFLVIAAIVLSPVFAVPFIRTAGAWLPRLAGRTGQLAKENALRNPRRTAATSAALMVGLALVSGSTILGASANASIERLVGDTITADYIVSTNGMQPFTPQVAHDLRNVARVSTVVQERYGTALFDGEESNFSAFDADDLTKVMRLDFVAGDVASLAGRAVLVDESTANSNSWSIGDTVRFQTSHGQRLRLEIGGIYAENQGLSPYVVSMKTYQETGGVPMDRYLYLDVAGDSAEVAAGRDSLEAVTDQYPVVDLMNRDEFAEKQQGHIKEMLTLINALLILSIIIAVLGVINTLVLSVIERTRELGLLRAIGMSRRQLRQMVRLESVLIAVYGAVLGLGLGTLLGVTMTKALRDEGIGQLVVPGADLSLFLLLGAIIGVLASALPARRASRLKVLDAIATQ